MDVGLVVFDGLGATSGGYRYDRKVVERLRDRGHAVRVLALERDDYATLVLDGSTDVAARLADLDVDVLLQDELCHPALVRANHRVEAAPVVAVVHHLRCSERWSPPRTALYRAVERRYLRSVDAVVANTETTLAAVEDLVGPTQGVVAPPAGDHFDPGVSDARIRARSHAPGPLRVVFVGSLVERKGLTTLVRGLARRPADEWTLTVVGDPTVDAAYARRVEQLVATLGIGDAVTFAGRVPDDRLAAMLRRQHVLAVPSEYEGFGMVYLEGMGFGLPAVASAAGGASEVVTAGETGFLVPPNDPDAVGEALATLAGDRDRLAAMGVAARNRFEAHPTWDEVVDRVAGFLRTVADAGACG